MRMSIIPDDPAIPTVEVLDGSMPNVMARRGATIELVFDKDGTSGWYDAPEVKESTTGRPQSDGDYWPSRLTMSKRVVTIRAHAVQHDPGSSVELGRFNDLLNQLTGQPLTLLVEDQSGIRSSRGFLSAQTAWQSDLGYTSLTLIVTCPDPFKYGQVQSFAASKGSIQAVNEGTAPTWPTILVTGHVTRLSVAIDGHRTEWQGDTTNLTIDMRDMIPSAGGIVVDDPMPLRPGRTDVTVQADKGADVTLRMRPAWK